MTMTFKEFYLIATHLPLSTFQSDEYYNRAINTFPSIDIKQRACDVYQ